MLSLSKDASPFSITPEIIIYPRNTDDIRKLARFSWKLAEKGHTLAITPRGGGGDTTGGAIGEGVLVMTSSHMNKLYEYDSKQRLIRLQPGASVESVQNSLALYGMTIDALGETSPATIGGSIGARTNAVDADQWVDQLEVVLANGDVMQTKRLSKRELNRKKGEQTFEAEVYRSIDNLITDNQELIAQLQQTDRCRALGIITLKQKDGSLDLTPLFFASQGTLGIISELIVKADLLSAEKSVVVASFASSEQARDALDGIEKIGVSSVDILRRSASRQSE